MWHGEELASGGPASPSRASVDASDEVLSIPAVDFHGSNARPARAVAPRPSRSAIARGAEGATVVPPTDVTVLLAAINERANLPGLFADIERACGKGVQLVVIDDGSTDGTREYLRAAARENESLRYIFNAAPQTIVGAHIQGMANCRTPYIVMMDSDGQHPPEAIPRLLRGLAQGKDVVVATRFGPGGSTGGRSAFRGLMSRVAAVLIQVTVGNTRSISDPTSGFFAVRRRALVPFTRDLRGYETLVFVLAMMDRPRIGEVSYIFRARGSGESKVLRGWSFFRVFFTQLVAAKRTELDARRRAADSQRLAAAARVASQPTVAQTASRRDL